MCGGGLLFLVILFRAFVPPYILRSMFGGKQTTSSTRKIPASSMRRSGQSASSEADALGRLPISEFHTTYTVNDRLFDLSFELERAGQYLGECGISVVKIPGLGAGQVSAFEFWLFDAGNSLDIGKSSTAKILVSEFCNNQPSFLGDELAQKAPRALVQVGSLVTIETDKLTAKVKITEVEYSEDPSIPNGIFKRVVFKIGVWSK